MLVNENKSSWSHGTNDKEGVFPPFGLQESVLQRLVHFLLWASGVRQTGFSAIKRDLTQPIRPGLNVWKLRSQVRFGSLRLCISLVPWVELWGINLCSFPIGTKAADSFMFHYPRNVYCGIREQSHITGWHSPFNHPPPAPHPCNHVSSYIIAFQLLTGVWPLPPNMPNLIHVFPQRQRDALFWKTEEEKKEHASTCCVMPKL